MVSRTGDLSLEEVMRYERRPYPTSLFDEKKNILRKADKHQLAQAIADHCNKIRLDKGKSDTIRVSESHSTVDSTHSIVANAFTKAST